MYYAHITEDNRKQTVKKHLENVAFYAEILARKINLNSCGKLCGLLHDIGKYSNEFQDYLILASQNKAKKQKGPDHSTAGAVWIVTLGEKYNKQLTAQILALVIMGHHGGLIDVIDMEGASPFIKRLNKLKEDQEWLIGYEQVQKRMEKDFNREKLESLFLKAHKEIVMILKQLKQVKRSAVEANYYCGVLCKMLYSCLIDADRYDTATFMDDEQMQPPPDRQVLWNELALRFEKAIQSFPKDITINVLRQKISQNCYRNALEQEPGKIYTLNCPTGSGKTMASLRYALNHAKKYHKNHIFYIIPYITITEQNASEVKKKLSKNENDPLVENNILELHSAIEIENQNNEISSMTTLSQNEILAERLEHPIIFTTMVRFLNTFLSGGTKNIRPAHQFANSIIIFDEIQTISPKCIALFNGIINFLSKICGTTIVLSTATQPLLDQTPDKVPKLNIEDKVELSGCQLEDYQAFKRTQIIDKQKQKGYTKEELSHIVWETAKKKGNVLIVFNTKRAVRDFYDTLQEECGDLIDELGYKRYVLTTNLYPKHRKKKIEAIRRDLKEDQPLIVISTQLIEAGVDISFKAVYRSKAGLDNIIQTGGRCNRHGELNTPGEVYIINPDFESLRNLEDIRLGQDALDALLSYYKEQEYKYYSDLSSIPAIEDYFRVYQRNQAENMYYSFSVDKNTDYTLYDLLSNNLELSASYANKEDRRIPLKQSFKSAIKYFRAIEEHGIPVVVQCQENKELITTLLSESKTNKEKYQLLHQLQSYTVNISENLYKELGNAIYYKEDLGIYLLNESYYDEIYGVTTSPVSQNCCF